MSSAAQRIGEFFDSEYHRMVSYVRGLIRDAADSDASDIIQDVLVSVISSADAAAPIENLAAYVYRGLRNRVIDRMRKRKPVVSLSTPIGYEDDSLTLADMIPGTGGTAADAYENKTRTKALKKAIDNLDPKSRAVVIATEFHGRNFKDLAEEWREPIGTLLSRKSRALRAIGIEMAEYRYND